MRYFIAASYLIATVALSQNRTYLPRVFEAETPALDDGEITAVVNADGTPVGLKHGDGVTSGGRWLFDDRKQIKLSPMSYAGEADYTTELGGAAYWSNGVVSMFPPGVYSNVTGVVTVRLVNADQKIESISPTFSGTDYSARTTLSSDSLSATIESSMQSLPYPGGVTPTLSCYLESLSIRVYQDGALVGSTQDTRGIRLLVAHPVDTPAATNAADHFPVSMGWYDANVQASVGLWSGHPATDQITQRAGMRIDDGIVPKHFTWSYQPNGFLTLAHDNLTNFPVISIESIDPTPWIVTTATGAVSTLVFTTNGISGTWVLQTCTDLSAPAWTNAVTLSTNSAAAGYMSLTASNILGGSVAFWRANCIGGVQQEALVRFGPPVRAPRFDLDDGVYLFWSNDALRVHSGGSNGVVSVSW